MDQVPNIISTKDFSYISDMFNWNYHALKQANHFANEVQDEETKTLLNGIIDMHYYHCMKLISILSKEPLDIEYSLKEEYDEEEEEEEDE